MHNRFELSTPRLILIGADEALLRAELDDHKRSRSSSAGPYQRLGRRNTTIRALSSGY